MRPRARRKRLVRAILACALVVGAISAVLLLYSGPSLRMAALGTLRDVLRDRLSEALGVAVSIDRLSLDGTSVTFEGLVAGGDASATPLLRAARGRAELAWSGPVGMSALSLARLELRDVQLDWTPGGHADGADGPVTLGSLAKVALDAPIDELSLVNFSLRVRGPSGSRRTELQSARASFARRGRSIAFTLEGGGFSIRDTALGALSSSGRFSSERLELERCRVALGDSRVELSGELDWATAEPELAARGDFELAAPEVTRALLELTRELSLGQVGEARSALGDFELRGPLRHPLAWQGRGRVRIEGAVVQAPDLGARVELAALRLDAERTHAGLRVASLEARGAGLEVQGSAEITEHGLQRMSGRVRVDTLAALRGLAPGVPLLGYLRDDDAGARGARVDFDVRGGATGVTATGHVELGAAHLLAAGGVASSFSGLRTDFEYRPGRSELVLEKLSADTPAGTLSGSARVAGSRHHLELHARHLDLARLSSPGNDLGLSGTATLSLSIDGTPRAPLQRMAGTLAFADASLLRPAWAPGAGSLRAQRGSGRFVRSDSGRWRVSELRLRRASWRPVDGGDLSEVDQLSGEGELDEESSQLQLQLSGLRGALLDSWLPDGVRGARLDGHLAIRGNARDRFERVSGDVRLQGARWQLPQTLGIGAALELERASAHLSVEPNGWTLSSLELESDAGRLQGEVRGGAGRYRAELSVEPAFPSFAQAWLPGRFDSGELAFSASLRGSAEHPVEHASGRLSLKRALWRPAPGADLCDLPVFVRRASGRYRWNPAGLLVEALQVNTSRFRATGSMARRAGATDLSARLESDDAGGLTDLFPALAGLVLGGRGQADLTARMSPAGVSGHLDARIDDAVLVLGDPAPAHHPVRHFAARYEFDSNGNRLRRATLRGPELNLDLDAAWSSGRGVSGSGRLWLTRGYADEVSNGGGWALALLGRSRLDTAFRLSGNTRDVRLDADLAHGVRWRLLRLAVPDEIEAMARGEAPILGGDAPRDGSCPAPPPEALARGGRPGPSLGGARIRAEATGTRSP